VIEIPGGGELVEAFWTAVLPVGDDAKIFVQSLEFLRDRGDRLFVDPYNRFIVFGAKTPTPSMLDGFSRV
jgi:hypothetical protein